MPAHDATATAATARPGEIPQPHLIQRDRPDHVGVIPDPHTRLTRRAARLRRRVTTRRANPTGDHHTIHPELSPNAARDAPDTSLRSRATA